MKGLNCNRNYLEDSYKIKKKILTEEQDHNSKEFGRKLLKETSFKTVDVENNSFSFLIDNNELKNGKKEVVAKLSKLVENKISSTISEVKRGIPQNFISLQSIQRLSQLSPHWQSPFSNTWLLVTKKRNMQQSATTKKFAFIVPNVEQKIKPGDVELHVESDIEVDLS